VEKIRQLDVNIAAEFIYMAAVLVQIKSRMLLPRDPDAAEDQTDDPRQVRFRPSSLDRTP